MSNAMLSIGLQSEACRRGQVNPGLHVGVSCKAADPFVINALGIGEYDASCRHAAKARFMVWRG